MSKRVITPVLSLLIILVVALLINKYSQKKLDKQGICKDCNIVLIDIDTLRADSLPCYGGLRNTAPNICKLAQKSVIFENNYSTSYWTLPSIFSTVTSLYPNFHKIQTPYVDILNIEENTLAKTLQNFGYQTAYIGWLGNTSVLTNQNNGLVDYDIAGNIPVNIALSQMANSNKPWFLHYYIEDIHIPYTLSTGTTFLENSTSPKNFPISIDDYNILLNKYLKKNYQKIFRPQALAEFSNIILSKSEENDVETTNLFNSLISQGKVDYLYDAWMPKYNAYLDTFDRNNSSDLDFLRLIYDTKIYEVDQKLKDLFKLLESRKYSRNTIIIINSDHGETFGKYGTIGHEGNYHTESYHVPLIIYSPKLKGTRINQITSNIDIFPTIMQLIGVNIPSGLQGKALLTDILNHSDNDRYIYSHSVDGLVIQNKKWLYFLRYGSNNISDSVLFDKQNDSEEKINVANKYPEVTKALFTKILIYRSYGDDPKNSVINSEILNILNIDNKKLQRLRKEGYF